MSRLLNIIFLCLSASFLFSGTDGTIRGQVTDVSDEPIPGVQILIEELSQGAVTDLNGDYIILNVQVGTYDVRASMIGYAVVITKDVNVTMDQSRWLNWELKEEAIEGEIIEVTGQRGLVGLSNSELTQDRLEAIKKLLNESKNYAPDFSLKNLSDSLYVLSELRGKVVLINFWATWCAPCIMEIPDFNELYDKYHDLGFEILGISIDNPKQKLIKQTLIDFSKKYGVKYPLLYGSNKDINQAMTSYGGIYSVPSSFLVGVNGEIIDTYQGAILKQYNPSTYFRLEQTIISELNKPNQDSK